MCGNMINVTGMSKTLMMLSLFFLLLLILAAVGKMVLMGLFPLYDCSAYWFVPSFFVGFYTVTFAVLLGSSVKRRKFAEKYLAFKAVKLLITLAFMLVMLFVFRENAKVILLMFLAFYLLMMIPETLLVLYIKKVDVKE